MTLSHARTGVTVLLLLAVGLVVPAPAVGQEPSAPSAPSTDVVLVTDGDAEEVSAELAAVAGAEVDELPAPLEGARIRVPAADAEVARRRLAAQRIGVRVDTPVQAARVPNDPIYPQQWAFPKMRAPAAWDVSIGDPSVVVAVLDTGVDADHPDLGGGLLAGYDFVNNDPDPADDHGHGTAVAGLVAARSDNQIAVASGCWRCRILPAKVLDHTGSGTASVVADAIVWSVDRGADIINLSLVSVQDDPLLAEAVAYATSRDVVVVAAAGNSGRDVPTYPGDYPSVLAVAASDQQDRRYEWSNHGAWVDVAAPGCTVTIARGGGTGQFCGTSASAPLVAATAGLIRSVRPDLVAADVRRLIEDGATPIGSWAGHGRVDMRAAVPAPVTSDGDQYVSLPPSRILDTRIGLGAAQAPVGSRSTIRLDVTGRGGIPSTGVRAVVLNVTATKPTRETYVTVWPAGRPRPVASNLNLQPGQQLANLVTVKVGSGGYVDLYNHYGTVELVADVAGYYADDGGAMYQALSPTRLVDSRTGTDQIAGRMSTGDAPVVQVAGHAGVPATGATAVIVNVTAVGASRDGYLTLYPADAARPGSSTVNFEPKTNVPNLAIVRLSRDGAIRVHNFAGRVDVLLDVAGYFTLTETGATYHPLDPIRIVDTRYGTGGSRSPIGHRGVREVTVAGVGGVPASGATAVVANLTATKPTASETYLTAYPSGTTRPVASNLNLRRGETFPNLAAVTIGTNGRLRLYNHSGSTDVIVDLGGYFAGA